ncbi:MAG: hypothetical protein WHV67_01805 [Thermoanaerobaculia bacterium]
MLYKTLFLFLFCTLSFGSTCDFTFVKDLPTETGYAPSEAVYTPNGFLYVNGTRWVKVYNVQDPSNPIGVGNTEKNFSCGDVDWVSKNMNYFPGDTLLFLPTLCKGLRAYDISTPSSPVCVGFVENVSAPLVAPIVIGSKRYAIIAKAQYSYADYSDSALPNNCNDGNGLPTYSIASGTFLSNPSNLIGFEWQGKVYVAIISSISGFALYDVTGFPSSVSQMFSTSDKGYGLFFKDGKIYLNTTSGGLKIYSVPSGSYLGGYSNYNYSQAMGVYVDDLYIYLSLGQCVTTGGVLILDKSTLSPVVDPFSSSSVYCDQEVDNIMVGIPYNGISYVYRVARTNLELFKVENCGDYANIVLYDYTPKSFDPGASNQSLKITLKNIGNIAANNVQAKLVSSNTSYIQVNSPDTQSYGTISPQTTKDAYYNITVSPSAQPGSVPLTLNVTSSQGSFTLNFSLTINEPRAILSRTITKNVSSNSLDVKYTNTGNVASQSFSLTLTPYTKDVSFPNPTQSFSSIPANGGSQTVNYPYTYSGDCNKFNFISLYLKENPYVSETPAEYRNVDLLSGTALYPFIIRQDSTLSKSGTTYTLKLYLKNIGDATGNNVNVTLSSNRTDITWNVSSQNYGNILVNSTTYKEFTFDAPDGTSGLVTFTADITSDEGCWIYSFNHDLSNIVFQYVDEKHCVCGGNCRDLHPDIYEGTTDQAACITFNFKLKNAGSSTANQVPAILSVRDSNPNVEITYDTVYYTLNAGEENWALEDFMLSINGNFCSGDDSTCPKLKLRLSIPDFNFVKDLDFTVKASTGGSQPQPCYLAYKSNSLQITDSTADGVVNPGDSVQFTFEIQNTGGTDATNVVAEISEDASKEAYITLGTKKVNFGTIKAGQSARNTTPFTFSLSSDAPTGNYYFPLTITSSCSSTPFNYQITIKVSSSTTTTITLSYQSYYVTGSSDPNYLETGKEQTLYVTLKNESTTALQMSQATLTSSEPKVQILSQGTYAILPGKTASAPFTVFVDSSFSGTKIPFNIQVQNATVTNPNFSVDVGQSTPPPPQFSAYSIPIAVHSPGANGTFWKTDLFLQNPSSESQTLTIKLLKADTENEVPPQAQVSLSPLSSLTVVDVLSSDLFPEFKGYQRAGFLIEFSSSTAPFVSARIYNDQGSLGTYGQFVPGIPVSSKTRGTSGDIPAYLAGMAKNEKYRANMGLANVSSSYNELVITLIDEQGFPSGSKITRVLAPYNITQLDDIASQTGHSGNIGAFTIKVESNSKADFVAWGSVVDNITGDASFVNDQIQPYSKVLIMGVAHSKGTGNTNWRSDLNIYNPASADLSLLVDYYRYGYENFKKTTRIGPIPKNGSLIVEDILSQFKGLAENEAGFLIAYPEYNMSKNPIISTRTYNDLGTQGTYGQFVSGLDFVNGAATYGKRLVFSGITIDENFRANLGLLNAESETPNTITVSLYSKDGNLLSQFQEYMPYPTMAIQINWDKLLIEKFKVSSFRDCSVIVEGSGKTFAYISQVDNKTQDPIFIVPSIR